MNEDMAGPAYAQPSYLHGMLLAHRMMLTTIGLMVATKPELRAALLPALQCLRDALVGSAMPEGTLLGVDEVMDAIDRATA